MIHAPNLRDPWFLIWLLEFMASLYAGYRAAKATGGPRLTWIIRWPLKVIVFILATALSFLAFLVLNLGLGAIQAYFQLT